MTSLYSNPLHSGIVRQIKSSMISLGNLSLASVSFTITILSWPIFNPYYCCYYNCYYRYYCY